LLRRKRTRLKILYPPAS